MTGPVAANSVRLKHEVDASQSIATAKKIEGEYKKTHQSMNTQVASSGEAMKTMADRGAQATGQIAAGLGVATAAAASMEGAFLGAAGAVLGAFAAGGPVAGAIAIVAAGAGVVIGKAAKAREAFAQFGANAAADTASIRGEIEAMNAKLDEAAGKNPIEQKLKDIRRQIKQAEEIYANTVPASDYEDFFGGRSGSGVGFAEQMKRSAQSMKEMFGAKSREDVAAVLTELVNKESELLLLRSKSSEIFELDANVTAQTLLDQLNEQNKTLTTRDAKERALLEVDRQMLKVWKDIDAVAGGVPQATVRKLEDAMERQKAIMTEAVEESFPTQFDQLIESTGPTLQSTLSSSIMAGFSEGADGAKRVMQNLMTQIQGKILNMALGAGMQALGMPGTGGTKFFAEGGTMVHGPGLFVAGEGKEPELIQSDRHRTKVTPLSKMNGGASGGEGGGGGLTFAPVLGEGFMSLPATRQGQIIGEAWMKFARDGVAGKRLMRRAVKRSLN